MALAIVDDVGNVSSPARIAQGRARPQHRAIRKVYTATLVGQETLAYAERLQSQGHTVAAMGDPTLVAVQGECSPWVRRDNWTREWMKGPTGPGGVETYQQVSARMTLRIRRGLDHTLSAYACVF